MDASKLNSIGMVRVAVEDDEGNIIEAVLDADHITGVAEEPGSLSTCQVMVAGGGAMAIRVRGSFLSIATRVAKAKAVLRGQALWSPS